MLGQRVTVPGASSAHRASIVLVIASRSFVGGVRPVDLDDGRCGPARDHPGRESSRRLNRNLEIRGP